jgi:hypothetical protein
MVFFSGPPGAVKGARIPRSSQTLDSGCGPRTLVGEENGAGNSPATSAMVLAALVCACQYQQPLSTVCFLRVRAVGL